jgi:uncharacterized protein YdiU (UPF0061 family)
MSDLLTAPRGLTGFSFDNSYARLPDRFFARRAPTPVAAPRLIRLNVPLAQQLGLDPDALASPDGVAALAGNSVPQGAEPLAMAYAGHQFGNWAPQLGDGRAVLLGEVIDRDGQRRDIQLKGAGPTAYSRSGDGRAAIGPVLREYVVSEAMAALGIPTTRALAAVTTGEEIWRDQPLPGAVLTRIASSHIRVGTFQFFGNRGDVDGVRLLADHVIARHYPDVAQAAQPYHALLEAVIGRTARLIARWMLVGFIHGVMNTDNMSVAGETIDYGPCAFMDTYHPGTVYSSIDQAGRYAYGNQPRIALWNLTRLAEALLPLLDDDEETAKAAALAALDGFAPAFQTAYRDGLRRKLGLAESQPDDVALAQDLLGRMAENQADFTLTFRRLADAMHDGGPVRSLFADPAAFDAWADKWRERIAQEGGPSPERQAAMRVVNPAFIPRNHRVQAVIAAAETSADFAPLDELVAVLSHPYDDQPDHARYAEPPRPDEVVHQTFCGT